MVESNRCEVGEKRTRGSGQVGILIFVEVGQYDFLDGVFVMGFQIEVPQTQMICQTVEQFYESVCWLFG